MYLFFCSVSRKRADCPCIRLWKVSAAIIYLIMTCCISALLNKLSARLSLNTYRGVPSSN